jgi:hypothetical protein
MTAHFNLRRAAGSVLVLGIQVGLLSLLALPALASEPMGTPRCVNPADGGCYSTIQTAIDASSFGDLIIVAAGTYTEHIAMKDGVSVHGQGWITTTINGNHLSPNSVVSFVGAGIGPSTVFSGFKVLDGGSGVPSTSGAGGGLAIFWASPTVVNTWVDSCTGNKGGGIYVNGGAPSFSNVPAWFNQAQYGGGYYLEGGATVTITSDDAGTNGTVWSNSATSDGGGFWIGPVAATITGVRAWWNTAGADGGGLYVLGGALPLLLQGNSVAGNTASQGAGGYVFGGKGRLAGGNRFEANTAQFGGGGLALNGFEGEVVGNNISFNRVNNGGGGGISVFGSSVNSSIRANWLECNIVSGSGGGIGIVGTSGDTSALVDGNVLITNTAMSGGGMHLQDSGIVTITNNVFSRNVVTSTAGAGIALLSSPGRVVNNSIVDNTGGGIYLNLAVGAAIVNNIIVGNSGNGVERADTAGYYLDYNDLYVNGVDYSNVLAGAHDLTVDPVFVGTGVDVPRLYRLQPGSPVSATGSIAWAPFRDIGGRWRLSGGSVSMGAYEAPGSVELNVFLPLVLRN